MKKLLPVLLFNCLVFNSLTAQNVGVGTSTPDVSALLEIKSTAKGLLIPRVTTAQLNAVANPAKGLLLLDTSTNQLMLNMGTPSLPNWQSVVIGSGWGLKGNSGTTAFTNFIGTTDARPVVFKTANYITGIIDTNNISWGTGTGLNITTGLANTAIGHSSLYLDSSGSFNTVAGNASMLANRSGSYNTAMGNNSLAFSKNGNYNTAVGNEAMLKNKKGNANVAIGTGALWSDTAVNNIVAVGDSALFNELAIVGGGLNTAVGSKAMFSTVDGYANTAVGNRSLYSNTGGSGNTAFGDNSLYMNTTAWNNAAYGNYSLRENTTGENNVAIGPGAMQDNKTGSSNTALGLYALASFGAPRGGFNNVALGSYALYLDTSGSNNIAAGNQAMLFNRSGSNNISLGSQSLYFHQRGNSNIAIGTMAMYTDTTASNNTAIGFFSLYNQLAAYATNTAIGAYTLYNNISGTGNTTTGYLSLYNNKTGFANAVLGEGAMYNSLYCNANTALGYQALYSDTAGILSTAVGYRALYSQQTNNSNGANTGLGYQALYNNVSGFQNTGIGYNVLPSLTTGNNITAIGSAADVLGNNLFNATAIGSRSRVDCSNCMVLGSTNGVNGAVADVNVGIGNTNPVHARLEVNNSIGAAVAMFGANKFGVTIEADNPEVGFNYFYNNGQKAMKAGYASVIGMSTGTGELYIGNFNGNQSATDFGPIPGYRQNLTLFQNGEFRISGSVNFSHFYFGSNEDTYIRGGKNNSYVYMADQNTGVVIGAGGPFIGYKLTVQGATYNNGNLFTNGNLCATGTIGACSDIRYKTNIFSFENGLNIVQQLHPIYYNWKQHEFPVMQFSTQRQLGLSAQEVEKLLPEIVQTNTQGYKAVDYGRLTPVLIKGMQEQQQQIKDLQTENDDLKLRLKRLEQLILNR